MEIARISALAEMASGISHELNQPLGAIATFSQAADRMLNRPDPMVAQTREVLQQINHEALNAGEGIRRIRRLFEQDDASRTRCGLEDIIDEIHPLLDLLTQRISGRLQIDASPRVPPVNIDRLRIQHVLFALVQNACDASSQVTGMTPRIVIAVASDRYTVETSIRDFGAGVDENTKDQLFRPFFTTKSRGTGLGLASCRAIIDAHEGTIGFENCPTGGSRFWFRLPVAVP